ncbi:MAG: RRXRR domain-containing protein [Selenomonas sp.]|nr:RRXRR domain-containing protein [Selenomonas sp.]
MVFVIDANKTPLAMCHPAKARKLLRDGKAAIYRKAPFTIILKKEVDSDVKADYRLKIDYGISHTGLAILKGEKVCWLGQIDHRTNVQELLEKRKHYRRRRRTANLRYRKPRGKFRKKPKGWLPPSFMCRVNNIKTFVQRLLRMLPLGAISYENVKFDTQKMQNPDISGIEYQQGTLAGCEIREYLSEKFDHKCCNCGVSEGKGVHFEVEHIIPKSRGGSSRISNLAWSCHDCNQEKSNLTAEEYGHPEVQKQTQKPLKASAMVTGTRWKVFELLKSFGLPVECGTGGLTHYNRLQRNIPKEHCLDACCVGKSTPEKLYFGTKTVQIITAAGRGKHCRTNVNKFGFPTGYLSRQKQFFGFQTGDMVKAVVPNGKKAGTYFGKVMCRKRGSFDIKTSAGRIGDINHKYFQLVQRSDGYVYSMKAVVALPPHS